MRHDAGGTLGADHAAVDRVVAVAVDVTDAAVLEMHPDAAPAGAHVAGGGLDLVARWLGQRSVGFLNWHRATLSCRPGSQCHRRLPGTTAKDLLQWMRQAHDRDAGGGARAAGGGAGEAAGGGAGGG